MGNLKLFLTKLSTKFIPSEKFISVVSSHAQDLITLKICESILLENFKKIKVLSEGIERSSFLLGNNFDKILVHVNAKNFSEVKVFTEIIEPSFMVLSSSDYISDHIWQKDEDRYASFEKLISRLPKKSNLILGFQDPKLHSLAQISQAMTVTYGYDVDNCHVWASNIRVVKYQTVFELNYGVERVEVSSKLLGFRNLNSMLGASALGLSLKIPLTAIKRALEKVDPIEHELDVVSGHNSSIILDDSKDFTPTSFEDALFILNALPARRRILVLGEIKNLGVDFEKLNRRIARLIFINKLDIVILGTGSTKIIADELDGLGFLAERMQNNLQNPQIVSKLLKMLSKGDVVLITGGSGIKFEEVVKKVAAKK